MHADGAAAALLALRAPPPVEADGAATALLAQAALSAVRMLTQLHGPHREARLRPAAFFRARSRAVQLGGFFLQRRAVFIECSRPQHTQLVMAAGTSLSTRVVFENVLTLLPALKSFFQDRAALQAS